MVTIHVPVELKNRLDSVKLVSCETYNSVISRGVELLEKILVKDNIER